MTRRCLALVATGWLVAVILAAAPDSSAWAAPVQKAKADSPADLAVLHEMIGRIAEKGTWADADRKQLDQTVRTLLDNLTAASGLPKRNPPVALGKPPAATFFKEEWSEKQEPLQKQCVIGPGGHFTQPQASLILVAGDAEVVQTRDCVIVASGDLKLSQTNARSCVAIAGKTLEAIQCGHIKLGGTTPTVAGSGDCVLVAGTRMKLSQCKGVIAYVLKPEPDGDKKPITAQQTQHSVFMNPEDVQSMKQCRDNKTVAPKYPPAK